MLYRLRRFLNTKKHGWLRDIRRTPPLTRDARGPIFVSQLASVYVDMYLLAVKSAALWVAPSRVVVLSDGSLTPSDLKLLRHHVPGLEVLRLEDVDVGPCPRGGTWERLTTCIALSRENFVLQIDSDTVTLREPRQVLDCIAENRSYTMSGCMSAEPGDPSTRIMSWQEAADARAAEAQQTDSPHIQILSETNLVGLPQALGACYIRGCSGFAGFARGAISEQQMYDFSSAMEQRLGARWHEWGTEQVSSNFLIANAPGGCVLEWPAYAGQMAGVTLASTMIHFTGEHRFNFGTYEMAASSIVTQLRRQPVQ